MLRAPNKHPSLILPLHVHGLVFGPWRRHKALANFLKNPLCARARVCTCVTECNISTVETVMKRNCATYRSRIGVKHKGRLHFVLFTL